MENIAKISKDSGKMFGLCIWSRHIYQAEKILMRKKPIKKYLTFLLL